MSKDEAQHYYDRFSQFARVALRIETTLPEDASWACVVRFYAALHLVSAYLSIKKRRSFDSSSAVHAERSKALRDCSELREAPARYRELKDLSESVRYDPGFTFTQKHHESAKNCLTKIVAIVEPKLKQLLGIS